MKIYINVLLLSLSSFILTLQAQEASQHVKYKTLKAIPKKCLVIDFNNAKVILNENVLLSHINNKPKDDEWWKYDDGEQLRLALIRADRAKELLENSSSTQKIRGCKLTTLQKNSIFYVIESLKHGEAVVLDPKNGIADEVYLTGETSESLYLSVLFNSHRFKDHPFISVQTRFH